MIADWKLAAALAGACMLASGASPCDGQTPARSDAPHVTLSRGGADGPNAAIVVTLDRPLAPDEGELALFLDGTDVTAVSERTPGRIVYRPSVLELSPDPEIVVYRRSTRGWTELRRFTARLRQTIAGATASADKSATLGNTGQLAQGQSAGLPLPDRRTFQDFVLNAGVHGSRESSRWSFTTQSNYVGVTRRQQALRFATRGDRAPMFDLSDYVLSARASDSGASTFGASLGHVTFGESRHLVNSLAARGAVVSLDRGATSLRVGALSSTAEVGWSDLVGLDRPRNRLFGASVRREMIAARPGALRLDVTLLDASRLPATSFTQSAIADAQRSLGSSVEITAATPNQRVRAVAGYSRSRFEFPLNDPQLRADSITRRPAPATRGARFVEMSAVLLENAKMPGGTANITIGVHDERVDPLYGTIGATVAADRQQDAADVTVSWGALSAQLSQSIGRDNLGRVASVLTTDSRITTTTVAIPVAALVRTPTHAAWFPMLTTAFNRTHQFADGVPTNGQFRPTDLPDQVSAIGDVAATWQAGRYRLSLHGNHSAQDNREQLRERADFDAATRTLSVGARIGTGGDVSMDLGDEYQLAKERDERTHTKRLTLNSALTPRTNTGIVAAVSLLRTRPPVGAATVNTEERLEISQGIRLPYTSGGEQRGQVFLRYARTTSLLPDAAPVPVVLGRTLRQQWSVASGLSLRLF